MLVPDQMVEVRIVPSNVMYYRNLGYKCKSKDILMIPVTDLSKCSTREVKIICDYCGKELSRPYVKYNQCKNGLDCCEICRDKKRKQTCLDKYGVESVSSLKEIKEKVKETCIERYGDEHPAKLEFFKEKAINTNLEKYGVEYSTQLQNVKEKIKNTNLKRYGTEFASSSEVVKTKTKETMLRRYGAEYTFKVPEIKEKIDNTILERYGYLVATQNKVIHKKVIDTMMERYGVEYYTQSKEGMKKIKDTCLDKYGVESYSQTDEFVKNYKKNFILKYGVENPMQLDEIKNKMINTLANNGNVPTSSQQITLHKMIKERYPEAILNHPYDRCVFDIALILEDKNIKIDIEYDCWYWHDIKKDICRDYFSTSKGWKVLRVKSANKLPSEQKLFEAIEYLINTEHHHIDIILDDWKEPDKEVSA